jgi:hypothetical protein
MSVWSVQRGRMARWCLRVRARRGVVWVWERENEEGREGLDRGELEAQKEGV